MKTITTVHSTYEVDEDNRQIRRVTGRNQPHPFLGTDGTWHPYAGSEVSFDGGLWFWDDQGYGFRTSSIIRITREEP